MSIEKWKNLAPKKENKISEESASEQLKKLLTYYETDFDDAAPELETAINQIMGRILSAFMQGKIELKDEPDGKLSIIQHIKKSENGADTLTYRALKGGDKVKIDQAGNDPTARMHCLMGLLSGYGADAIGKLSAGDLRVTEGLAGFFCALC